MLAAARQRKRHGDITPKIGQAVVEEEGVVRLAPARVYYQRGQQQPVAEEPTEPEPPVLSEAERQQRDAMIEALRRELGSTEVTAHLSPPILHEKPALCSLSRIYGRRST